MLYRAAAVAMEQHSSGTAWPVSSNGNLWPGLARKERMDAMASGGALMYDLMIIRKQLGEKKNIT
jgi:hypothetical protein